MVDCQAQAALISPVFLPVMARCILLKKRWHRAYFQAKKRSSFDFFPKKGWRGMSRLNSWRKTRLLIAQSKCTWPMLWSARSDSGQVISDESITDDKNPIANDLRDTLQEWVNRELNEWAYNAAVYGAHYVRVYGEPKKALPISAATTTPTRALSKSTKGRPACRLYHDIPGDNWHSKPYQAFASLGVCGL